MNFPNNLQDNLPKAQKKALLDCCPRRASCEKRRRPTLPHFSCSTIGARGLNFSVRDGKRWNPTAITTLSCFFLFPLSAPLRRSLRFRFLCLQGEGLWVLAWLEEKRTEQWNSCFLLHSSSCCLHALRHACCFLSLLSERHAIKMRQRRRLPRIRWRAISTARLWRRRLCACSLSTS